MVRVGIAAGFGALIGLSGMEVRAAGAEERPLLVSVEVEPGATADVAQVRRAIGIELGRPVLAVAQREAPGADPDLLLVNVSRDRIALSMHRRADETVARDLPVPADRGARLRAIAWLAGNLARDQASPFLQATAAFGAAETPPPAPEAAAPPEATSPAPTTEPPPVAAPPLPTSQRPASGLRADGTAPVEPVEREWSVLLAGGPLAVLDNQPSLRKEGLTFQLEVVKHRPDRWIWGLGIDYAVDDGRAGFFALGGLEARWNKVRLDGTLGLGVVNANVGSFTSTVSTSPDGQTQTVVSTMAYSHEYVPYARAFVTASYALTPSWDLVARAGGHTADRSFAAGAGLRYNIP